MLLRTQWKSCRLNPFPTSGKKSLFILELRIEGAQKWRLGAMLEITSCAFSSLLEPWDDFFNTAVSVGKCAALSRVLKCTSNYVTVAYCLFRKCKFPLFKLRAFILGILRAESHLWRPLSVPSSHDFTFRWLQRGGHFPFCVVLDRLFSWELHGMTIDVSDLEGSWLILPLEHILVLLVQGDSPVK
jgi:hypothetical protein